ncbi:uncharacterized protein BDZ83DRAFT_317261 [Colletotrichum acutatum]|uniref:Uncharacterized protein n=1 Tax=Glomerella acutata TaxID=27357 RepID=A0AAD8XIU8_GLOAC|nr:uncharacterized protein BDZ83DRAFT_317261 [Colletotrichum acutatum]KAK1725055.1 hypothetical protein BDZ83DRAFT_317261 [Colletotrichum acutatum]
MSYLGCPRFLDHVRIDFTTSLKKTLRRGGWKHQTSIDASLRISHLILDSSHRQGAMLDLTRAASSRATRPDYPTQLSPDYWVTYDPRLLAPHLQQGYFFLSVSSFCPLQIAQAPKRRWQGRKARRSEKI